MASADELLDLVMAYGAAEYAHGVANTADHTADERITARRELCKTRDALHQAVRGLFSSDVGGKR